MAKVQILFSSEHVQWRKLREFEKSHEAIILNIFDDYAAV